MTNQLTCAVEKYVIVDETHFKLFQLDNMSGIYTDIFPFSHRNKLRNFKILREFKWVPRVDKWKIINNVSVLG